MALHHGVIAPYNIELHLATTEKSWAKLRRDNKSLPKRVKASGTTGRSLWMPPEGEPGCAVMHVSVCILIADYRASERSLVGVCAHEAVHAATFIYDHLGEQVSSDEPFAYLVDWITTWLYERVR